MNRCNCVPEDFHCAQAMIPIARIRRVPARVSAVEWIKRPSVVLVSMLVLGAAILGALS